MKKNVFLICLLFGMLSGINAQVVFDPATYEPDSLPDGMTIVDIEGTPYLQVILNGWSSSLALNPVEITASTHFSTVAKYAVGTSGYELSNINTFLKLANGDYSVQIGAAGAASSATFAEYSVNIENQGTIANFQVAGQERTGWTPVVGDTLWVGAVTVYPYTPPRYVEGIVARETFGAAAYDVNGPAQPVGYATHFDWDDVTTFTSTNGHIESGSDSSVRINDYDNTLTRPEYWRSSSSNNHVHMAIRDIDAYLGSWDTLQYLGIDLTVAQEISAVEFGYARARTVVDGDTARRSLNVEYRLDGGAWTQMDTSLIINEKVFKQWDYIVMPVEFVGDVLDIRFSCIQPNEQIFLDDLTVVGTVVDTQAPTVPANLAASVDGASVTLTWDASTDNDEVAGYIVSLGDEDLETVTALTYTETGLDPGTYTFGVSAVDLGGNVSAKATVEAETIELAVENSSLQRFNVYPNPANSELNISGIDDIQSIQIVSITGSVVINISGTSVANVSDLKEGLYMVKVQSRSGVYSTTFVKE